MTTLKKALFIFSLIFLSIGLLAFNYLLFVLDLDLLHWAVSSLIVNCFTILLIRKLQDDLRNFVIDNYDN